MRKLSDLTWPALFFLALALLVELTADCLLASEISSLLWHLSVSFSSASTSDFSDTRNDKDAAGKGQHSK
jgi:hypothetical protein